MTITSKAIKIFMEMDKIGKIYTILFVVIMFCGNTIILKYVPYLIIAEIFLLFCMSIVKKVKRDGIYNKNYLLLFFILLIFTFYLLLQTLIAFSPSITMTYFRWYIVNCFLLLFLPCPNVIYCCIKLSKFYALIAGITIIIFSIITGEKSGGLLGDYQAAGMMMSIACIMFILDFFQENRTAINIIGLVIALTGLFISGKRMFSLLVVICFIVLLFITDSKRKPTKVISIFSSIIAITFLLYRFVKPAREIFDRIAIIFSSKNEFEVTSGRSAMWEVAIIIFNKHKLVGIGFGNFQKYTALYDSLKNGLGKFLTHNIYYGLLCETGIIGTIIFLTFMILSLIFTIIVFIKLKKTDDRLLKYIICYSMIIQIWFIIYGYTGNGIYDSNELFIYITAIATMLSVKNYLFSNNLIRFKKFKIKL